MQENKSKNTKSQILSASLKLFSEKSYHGGSIRDIAKSIGKRESSIYNHFSSKEEILSSIVSNFTNRNFGKIILTDELINLISKPEKFFLMLGLNLIDFWKSDNERMFIKILIDTNSLEKIKLNYSLNFYLNDFRKLTEFIFEEMIKHKFIRKSDVSILSREYLSPLFMLFLETSLDNSTKMDLKVNIKNHIEFFWKAIKR